MNTVITIAGGILFILLIIWLDKWLRSGSPPTTHSWQNQSADGLASGIDRGTSSKPIRRALSAAQLLEQVEALQKSSALWPEITLALNPDNDPNVHRHLEGIRGHHLFVPHIGLNVIEDGCRRALGKNANANSLDALEAIRGKGTIWADPN